MKKKSSARFGIGVAAAVAIPAFVCALAWSNPSRSLPDGDGSKTPKPVDSAATAKPAETASEERRLAIALERDGRISQIAGFVVERREDKLLIGGKPVADSVAAHYLPSFSNPNLYIEVRPLLERQRRNPGTGLLQLLQPVQFSSPGKGYTISRGGC